MRELIRCPWALKSAIEQHYHDTEWGVPCWDENRQFEFMVLESAQAGLSWRTVLNKREGYRQAFAGFAPGKVAQFGPEKERELLQNPAIIRNRLKIAATINNARCFLEIQAKYGGFCNYLWNFVDGRPIVNTWRNLADLPAQTPLAQKISKDLKRHGFKFLGPVVVYSHLQATGLINDHLPDCFRHREIMAMGASPAHK
jgi:DNA-3-methyladenine glycosylase I